MKKRIIQLLFIIFAYLSTQQVFAYDFEIDGIRYTITSFEESTVRVDGLNQTLSGIIEIPSSIIYNNRVLSVTSIKSCSSNNIETVLIPTSITTIEDVAFENSSIKTISIPNSITYLGLSAFYGCKNLKGIEIPKTINRLRGTVSGCSSLTRFEWRPEANQAYMMGDVFGYCTSLKTIRIPNNVFFENYSYASSVIHDCTSLDSLIIEDGSNNFSIAASLTSDREFHNCPIKYLYLGRNISIGRINFDLSHVVHLEVGDSVSDYLAIHLLVPNEKLKSLVIGKSLNRFSVDFCKKNNQTLEFIKIKSVTPPEAIGYGTTQPFSNYNYMNTILYVPKGAKSAYQSADYWKNFWNIEEISNDETEVNKCGKPLINYSEGRLSFSCDTDGVSFHSSISDSDIKSYNENEIQLNVTYNINVYASKPGYDNSDIATATLCWVDVEPQSEGLSDGLTQIKATPILIQSENGNVAIKGANDDTNIYIYGINGQLIGSTKSQNGNANIITNLQSGSIVIVKIGSKSVKTIIK